MSIKQRYSGRYKSGNTPWDVGRPDFNLIEVVTGRPVPPGKALDVGCGTGDNAIWLAQNGFQVTATDASDIAMDKARERAAQAGVAVDFRVLDFLESAIPNGPFGLVFDRGCFHSFRTTEDRAAFANNVAAHLADGGLWLSLAGNADDDRDGPGPPKLTALEIVTAVEPFLEILSLQTTYFESRGQTPPRAWRCLTKKRGHT